MLLLVKTSYQNNLTVQGILKNAKFKIGRTNELAGFARLLTWSNVYLNNHK